MDKGKFKKYNINMIFIAYNFFKYKVYTKKNIEFKKFVLTKIKQNFPNDDYLLPYSQYNKKELAEKLNCNTSSISGSFLDDLDFIMSKCNKLVFFPTNSSFIGSGVYLEIVTAKKNNIPIYGYDVNKDIFNQDFVIEPSNFIESDTLINIFNKKIKFL